MSRRALVPALALLALAFVTVWALLRPGSRWRQLREAREAGVEEERRVLEPASFDDLPGWREDDPAAALSAFLRSCRQPGDWKAVCDAAARVQPGEARTFFETSFQPFAVNPGDEGLFTGYYEPLLQGSRQRSERYRVPLYVRPPELVMVDLGDFREELKGQRIAGRVEDGELVPFPIVGRSTRGRWPAGSWSWSGWTMPVDAFFLQIQGSGRVHLAEGGEMRVGYAAQNGHPYFAIGKELIERGALRARRSPCSRSAAGWRRIRRWRPT